MDLTLALDTLRTVARTLQAHLCLSAADGDVSVGLDTLWRNAALRVLLSLACRDDAHHTVVDVDLVIAVQTFAACTRTLDVQLATVDVDHAVGLDARAGTIVVLVAVVFITAAGEDGGASAVDTYLTVC